MIESLNTISVIVVTWLVTYAIHATVLLGSALILQRLIPDNRRIVRDLILKGALVGSIATATLVLVLPSSPSVFTIPVSQRAIGVATSYRPWTEAEYASAIKASDFVRKEAPALAGTGSKSWMAKRIDTVRSSLQILGYGLRTVSPVSWILILWMSVAGILSSRRLVAYNRFINALSRWYARPGDPAARMIKAHERRSRALLSPVVTRSAGLLCPVAIAASELCLPEDFERRFTPEEQKGVLAHELAHIHRLDPVWRLLSEFASSIFFSSQF